MRHITNDKGDIGVLKVSADLVCKGYSIFNPVSATCPFDLLVSVGGVFLRVQVKYRIKSNGKIVAACERAVIKNSKIVRCNNEEFDVLAIYCPDTDKCYYINKNEMESGRGISLRIDPTINKQKIGIKLADDYLELKI